ncbi:MAG: TetR/AcrR family transcriptional regulator [Cumulibacter sp.]
MAEMTESGLPRAVAIGWGMLADPQNGPRRGLSHEVIVAKAIEIADEHGIAALTMGRLAKELGFTTMSLYRYVANKDELLLLMIGSESVLPQKWPKIRSDWRESLRDWAHVMRDVCRAHPWWLDVPRGPTSVLMPASARIADHGLQVLEPLGADDGDKTSLILVITSYVTAFVELERDLASQKDLSFGHDAMAELAQVITVKKYPALAPLLLAGGYVGGPETSDVGAGVDAEFEHGLDILIAGLAAKYGA